MLKDSLDVREKLIATARQMNVARINVNKSGNVSVRVVDESERGGFLITPTGIAYDALVPSDLVFIPLPAQDLSQAVGNRVASSEWALHARVYEQKASVGAIVHT
ncbi:MAG: class II aldolase/adducin family protein, partial [Burkholderiaceae bacterium]|nr:class II aldolase/adducin family protein [Burkholderiaceae bacterium]